MIRTLEDIAGADTAVPLTADRSLISHGWVQLAASGAGVRVGDTNVSPTRGIPIPDGQGMFFPLSTTYGADAYTLADIFAYIPSGASLSIGYAD